MKRSLLFIVFTLFILHLYAQTDTTIVYLDRTDVPCDASVALRYARQYPLGDHWRRTVYDRFNDQLVYVADFADAACTIFDGDYKGLYDTGHITGHYTQNKKDGTWKTVSATGVLLDSTNYRGGNPYGFAIRRYPDGSVEDSLDFGENGNGAGKSFWPDRKIMASGKFVGGKKEGHWIYNYKNGSVSQDVNYASDSALSYTCYTVEGRVQEKECYFEKEAEFKGGERAWSKWLGEQLSRASLPKEYLDGKISGSVRIQFVVDAEGKVVDVKVVQTLSPALDRVAVKVIQQSPYWEAAVQYNRKVRAYRLQPITFPKM